jgi:hypothetical protein
MSDPRATQDASTAHVGHVAHLLSGLEMPTLLTGVLLFDVLFGVLAVVLSVTQLAAADVYSASNRGLALGACALGALAVVVGLLTPVFMTHGLV